MNNILTDYYFALWELLVILFLFGIGGIVFCWEARRRLWNKHMSTLAEHDSKHFLVVHNNLLRLVAHGFEEELIYIKQKSAETLEELGDEQIVLREKQNRIHASAVELGQYADNILYAFSPNWDRYEEELLNVRQLVERILITTYPYSESYGVTLMPNLDDIEPCVLYRELTLQAVKNVIHNAIKYSSPGGVVRVDLSLANGREGTRKIIFVEVKDTGRGIREEVHEKIFDLDLREDGLLNPGSGLGLYLARKAARYQDGDVILVSSNLNQGSIFRIILPYSSG